jgi:hypothetical protein
MQAYFRAAPLTAACRVITVTPRVLNQCVDGVSAGRFGHLARRLGAAARASGLVAPAFRTPPRRPGALRTVRRLPGGPVVAVRIRARPHNDVVNDMVEGVIVVNGLHGDAAARVRVTLLGAIASLAAEPGLTAA